MRAVILLLVALSFTCAVDEAPIHWLPIAVGVGLTAASLGAVNFYCHVNECCNSRWIPGDIAGLQSSFEQRLFGQHLVVDTVLKSLQSHLRDDNPPKALVLSFHGWTGGGKNFVSKMIAEHVFSLGLKSSYVHLLSATLRFPHMQYVERYQNELRSTVRDAVKNCGRALFIFDEVEKMPERLLDSLKAFLDHHEEIDGVDYRKAIFIFISNAGGQVINRLVLEHWQEGNARETVQLKDLESKVAAETYEEHGGLKSSSLIERSLVSAFIPFLPLERSHVRLCVLADLKSKNYTVSDKVVDQVLGELAFFPDDTKLYSKRGCRGVSDKVNLIMEELGRA